MPAPTFTCDLNTLIQDSACLRDLCLSQSDRDAVDIYVRILNLKAIGGHDYTVSGGLHQLMADSSAWQKRACDELKAVDLYIDIENAIANGATFPPTQADIAVAVTCLGGKCLGREQTRGMLSFLKCAINVLGKPD